MRKKHFNFLVIMIVIILALNILIIINNLNLSKTRIIFKEIKEMEFEDNNLPELNLSDDPLSLKNFTKVNVSLTDNAILLRAGCNGLALVTNEIQIYSIKHGLENNIDIRPTIHDGVSGILENFNITMLMVKIVDKNDDLYFASMYFADYDRLLNIDAKPSDAIALAIRTKSPIYIENSVLKNYGQKIC